MDHQHLYHATGFPSGKVSVPLCWCVGVVNHCRGKPWKNKSLTKWIHRIIHFGNYELIFSLQEMKHGVTAIKRDEAGIFFFLWTNPLKRKRMHVGQSSCACEIFSRRHQLNSNTETDSFLWPRKRHYIFLVGSSWISLDVTLTYAQWRDSILCDADTIKSMIIKRTTPFDVWLFFVFEPVWRSHCPED